ncbi:endogenous retroviral envelope protein HEMO [Diceros bicornis minor]|uniref:endogenous retroviral envelope protein HEMO n=1 Tax=Diceros bicornis minor TaxID=77932 RepID=UPI0026EE5282|nr:endogenous retroviral envelope protein HEMO [Diceros bicornis minor]
MNNRVWYPQQGKLHSASSPGGIFRTPKGIVSDSITTPSGTNICQITKCSGWPTSHPCATWGIAAIRMVRLPNATDYIWVDQKSGLTWSGDKTRLYSCQNQTAGLLYQLFRNLFCSRRLTRAHGKWRCLGSNSASGTDHEIVQILGTTDSILTLSLNYTGLFIL